MRPLDRSLLIVTLVSGLVTVALATWSLAGHDGYPDVQTVTGGLAAAGALTFNLRRIRHGSSRTRA